jgi:hypothetical protein
VKEPIPPSSLATGASSVPALGMEQNSEQADQIADPGSGATKAHPDPQHCIRVGSSQTSNIKVNETIWSSEVYLNRMKSYIQKFLTEGFPIET